jgi:hypothetical protein
MYEFLDIRQNYIPIAVYLLHLLLFPLLLPLLTRLGCLLREELLITVVVYGIWVSIQVSEGFIDVFVFFVMIRKEWLLTVSTVGVFIHWLL